MRAVVYKGPFKVAVEDVPRSKIQNPKDAIVKITTTVICGSDLLIYEGRRAAKPRTIFGHENLGMHEKDFVSGFYILIKFFFNLLNNDRFELNVYESKEDTNKSKYQII